MGNSVLKTNKKIIFLIFSLFMSDIWVKIRQDNYKIKSVIDSLVFPRDYTYNRPKNPTFRL